METLDEDFENITMNTNSANTSATNSPTNTTATNTTATNSPTNTNLPIQPPTLPQILPPNMPQIDQSYFNELYKKVAAMPKSELDNLIKKFTDTQKIKDNEKENDINKKLREKLALKSLSRKSNLAKECEINRKESIKKENVEKELKLKEDPSAVVNNALKNFIEIGSNLPKEEEKQLTKSAKRRMKKKLKKVVN